MNSQQRALTIGCFWLCSWLPIQSHADTTPASLFRLQRKVVVEQVGPQCLDVDLELLAGAQPSLSDVRIFDDQNREIPYLLIPPPTGEPVWQYAEQVQSTVNAKNESGFEADFGEILQIDRFRVAGFTPPVLKRLRLEGSGDRTRYALLANDETLFDLPENGLNRLEFPITPGAYRYLRVTWDDRDTRPVGLPERVSVRLAASGARPKPTTAQVPFEARPTRPDISQWRVRLPAKQLPITALELSTIQPQLMRRARVSESRLTGNGLQAHLLGTGTLRRAERAGLIAADLRVLVQTPETSELILTVDNDNNPPLTLEAVSVELSPQPWLYFEAHRTGTVEVRYGAVDARTPHYDLEAERDNARKRPLGVARFAGPAHPRNPPAVTETIDKPNETLLHGSALEPQQFRFSRSILGDGGSMTSLRLDAAVLAHSEDLSDLRILDAENRQIPYILEQEAEPLVVALALQSLANDQKSLWFDARQSVYRFALPFSSLPEGRLAITTNQRVFRRNVALYVELPTAPGQRPHTRVIAQSSWVHADATSEPPPLELTVPAGTDPKLFLVVEDGDNVPLTISSSRLLLPAKTLRFFHAKGDALTMHYGSSGLQAPDYDLALLSQELEQLTSLESNLSQERNRPIPTSSTAHLNRWFWAVLVLTVLGLTALIVRLVRKA